MKLKQSGKRHIPALGRLLFLGLLAATLAGLLALPAAAQAQTEELPSNYDSDGDGLIEVSNLAQLNAIRYDLDGDGLVDSRFDDTSTADTDESADEKAAYAAAFPVTDDSSVCPADSTCTGYELTADLDFDTGTTGDRTDDAYYNDGVGWQPIGDHDARFTGVFDGDGHTIANLAIRENRGKNQGLFFVIGGGGVVRNLGLAEAEVWTNSIYDLTLYYTTFNVGALAAINRGTISEVWVTGSVTSNHHYVGGLVGRNYSTISDSYSAATVSGIDHVGGLVGSGGTISKSYATGTVSGIDHVGGLVGSGGTISKSYATGTVSGVNHVGGLAGSGGMISENYATGPVSGTNFVGGLVGYNKGIVGESYAAGTVSGSTQTGGLVGVIDGGSVKNSYATGEVILNWRDYGSHGGLVGVRDDRERNTVIEASYYDTSAQNIPGLDAVGYGEDTGAMGHTRMELAAPTGYTGIYDTWDDDGSDVWDFGTAPHYPALKVDFDGDNTATWQEFGYQLRQPLTLTATASGVQEATVSWDDITESSWTKTPQVSYVLYRDGVEITGYDGAALSYLDTGLTVGQKYAYQVALLLDGAEHLRSSQASLIAISELLSFGDGRLYDYHWHKDMHNGLLILPAATGGGAPLTYTVSPDLPPGLVFDPQYRTIDGIPTATQERVHYAYTVTDANGATLALPFSILVAPDLEPDFGEATIANQDYTENSDVGTVALPAATGGDGKVAYALTPDLPAGLSFDTEARAITGTPTEPQAETEYTYTATDYDDDTASLTFTIRVRASALRVSAANPVTVWEGDSASYTVSLGSAPTENVVVELSSDNSDVTAQPTSLTFTPDNWQTAQTVTLSVGEDADRANEQAVISHRIAGETLASVNVNVTDDESDRGILRDFYNATAGGSWTDNANWLSDRPLNQWHGVTVNGSGEVTMLVLDGNNLSGSLPTELGNLPSLTRLALNRNNLTGAIPSELGNVPNLSIIGLARNNLSGALPTSLGNLSGLQRLSLHDNTSLSGALPSGFTGMANLQRLAIANTGLCAPNTQAFDDWLDTVPDKPGGVPTCE